MKTLEKYSSLTEHLFNDSRVQRYGMMLVKHGLKGAAKKVNPALMVIDAGMAVLDACNSYLKYAKECEVTRQIVAENRLIEAQLSQQLEILKLDHKLMLESSEIRYQALARAVAESSVAVMQMQKSINQSLKHAHKMQLLVRAERENGISFEQLQALQKQLDEFIRSAMMCVMSAVED
ncbi:MULTISPECIES: hypothetical protein [Shewanella]|uniref:hypothetical protein n=1 Tax=Shewanella TaxID=22 RepID=UPI001CF3E925|nr:MULTISPECIES: hypothetical protein [Shewanella]MCB2381385.1 hypothetical protein [Shewanella sp. SR1]MCS6098777.1 hypothetical protein [Shewanella baltica]MCS6185386.1 hypothetical protein [Shewanella baltica]